MTLWQRYRALEPSADVEPPAAEYFCDNQADADMCAALVLAGRKRATSSALLDYQAAGEPLPEPGKLVIITDWSGEAKALIQTTRVSVRRFGDVPASFASLEGEGDGSLAWWRREHHAFWTRNLTRLGVVVDDDLQVVCEEFSVILAA